MFKHNRLVVAVLGIPCVIAVSTFGGERERSFESRVVTIVDSVLENHIDPPTRQEMILQGAKSVYAAADKSPPRELSKQVSDLATNEQITKYLSSLRSEFEQFQDFETRLIFGLFNAVPGGGILVGAEEAEIQGQLAANRYVGIGIALRMHEERPAIMKVFHDGPGWKAGVKADDVILKIDGASTAEKNLKQIVQELRGEEGSELTLVLQQSEEEPRELKVTRGVTFIPTIEGSRQDTAGQWQYTIESVPDVALLRVKQVGPSTLHELKKIAAKLRRDRINGIVLDLREGGGILHDVVMLADQFLEQGTIGFVKSLDSVTKHEAHPGCLFKGIPLAVLIHKSSNADRVYLTAALQDQNRAVVVGEPTQGETFVRSHVTIPGGDKILLATGLLQRGDGTTLFHGNGRRGFRFADLRVNHTGAKPLEEKSKPNFIMPDYVVRSPLHNEEREKVSDGLDPMLEKAIVVLKNREIQARTGNNSVIKSG